MCGLMPGVPVDIQTVYAGKGRTESRLCLAQMSSLEKWRDCFSPKP